MFSVAAKVAECHRGVLGSSQQVLCIRVSRLGLLRHTELHFDPVP